MKFRVQVFDRIDDDLSPMISSSTPTTPSTVGVSPAVGTADAIALANAPLPRTN